MGETDEPQKEAMRRITQIFDKRVTPEDSLRLFEQLGGEKWSFARACKLYENAIRCGSCKQNLELKHDIEIALLCSSIEAIYGVSHYTIFKDWLINRKLQNLSSRNEDELQRVLNQAYQEYVDTEPYREGAFHNFRKFLTENCPEEKRKSPIELYDKTEGRRQATFEESIKYIYARFRSLFLHTGVGRATSIPPKGLENAAFIGSDLLDLYRKKGYVINLLSVVAWFENVVRESLWHYLSR